MKKNRLHLFSALIVSIICLFNTSNILGQYSKGSIKYKVTSVKNLTNEEKNIVETMTNEYTFLDNKYVYSTSLLSGIINYSIQNNDGSYTITVNQNGENNSRMDFVTVARSNDFIGSDDSYKTTILDQNEVMISGVPCIKVKYESTSNKVIAFATSKFAAPSSTLDILGLHNLPYFPIAYTVYPKNGKNSAITFRATNITTNVSNVESPYATHTAITLPLDQFKATYQAYTLVGLKE